MIPSLVLLVSLGYAALLFTIAWFGDRYPLYPQRPRLRPVVYSLTLAVYCTSWTFYGAVGSAVRYGIGYLPIYLGPLLLFIFGWRILERLVLITQSKKIVSISDFIASRFGRSQRLAVIVAVIALAAAIPYLALQYKAVSESLGILGGQTLSSTEFGNPAIYVAAIMALFAILFGTRKVDATEHRPGLLLAIAFESLVKLVALVTVGLFSVQWLNQQDIHVVEASVSLMTTTPATGFISQTILAFAAMICLPRQFHVAVVECANANDIRHARWYYGIYLIIISVMVLPIAIAGSQFFGASGSVTPDSFVLAFPLAQHNQALALIAYIGGFSAATGMVIMVSVALSTIISNDLIIPMLLRYQWVQQKNLDMASTVLWIRRLSIVALSVVAYGYYHTVDVNTELSAFGLMSFAAVAQFIPAIIGGLYWRGMSRQGVEAGLVIGFLVWAYTLLFPILTQAGWFDATWLSEGLFGQRWLRPNHLLGSADWDPITHSVFWSLLGNTVTMLVISLRYKPGLGEYLRMASYMDPYAKHRHTMLPQWQGNMSVDDLRILTGHIVGQETANHAFEQHAHKSGAILNKELKANRDWLRFTELLLAAAVGAASARLVMTRVLEGSGVEIATVVGILDEASQELGFNRDKLLSTLENMDQAVSVVDAGMRLVAWNKRYQTMFHYPSDMLYVGQNVADLIRFNAAQGRIGHGRDVDVEQEVSKRIGYMKAGSSYKLQRTMQDGLVIEMRGQPLPDKGYVTSYSDVTEFKRVEQELREINETLEQRVAERTYEAEKAQETRSRFLTAISHDVLQPINAARLFASAMSHSHQADELRYLSERVDTSLRAAEELLDGLLDVSRLDAGVLKPDITVFDVGALMQQLAEQYRPVAQKHGIALRVHTREIYVRSDRRLLLRVVQNFLANALRYTQQGRVVLGLRRRGEDVVLQVWDTGPGIPTHHLQQIYDEFHRYKQPFDWDERGLGLGLSICQRIATLLEHALNTQSVVGQGSMFSITVPSAHPPLVNKLKNTDPATLLSSAFLSGMKVLCVDNDMDTLAGMQALLARWDIEVICASTIDEALVKVTQQPDVLLVDYHLHDRLDGLAVLDKLREDHPHMTGALLTADGSDSIKQMAKASGYRVLTKPIKPASLRAFLSAHMPTQSALPD